MKIPTNYKRKLRKIASDRGMEIDTLKETYEEIYNSDTVQEDPQFENDKAKHRYVFMCIKSQYQYRFKVKERSVIPVGLGGRYKTSNGWRANVFGIVRDEKGAALRRITLFGREYSRAFEDIKLFSKYDVKIGKFSNSPDYKADTRAKWEDSVHTGWDESDVIEKLNLKRFGVMEIVDYPSSKSDDYTDRTDWRRVQGLVSYRRTGEKSSGGKYYRYTVIDDECEERVNEDGDVINEQMTVWTVNRFWGISRMSLCDFVGYVDVDDDGLPTMNACLINVIKEGEQ